MPAFPRPRPHPPGRLFSREPVQRILVLIPTYDERESIVRQVTSVRETCPQVDVLVVDDASPDGTGELADALAAGDEHVHVLHRAGKEGLGKAYLAGFAWALDAGYDTLVEMDADGSHRAEDLPALLAVAGEADLVIGSRWVAGGAIENWPPHRKFLSVGGNQYVRVLLGMPVMDATAGFRVYRAEALRHIGLGDVASQGYCFQVDLTWRIIRAGLRVLEVPITFVERDAGQSKMSRDIFVESLRNVTAWGMRYRYEQARGFASTRIPTGRSARH
ncbi:polyprenol monophosphomannose synthase [Mobilicoccus massiliensis]|uniref:polyprenol monophosphomannose synthase n=1 Tax=Mobilicoccus massiliensis TaxID=1522310 RepID=UPI0006939C1B|nr:polyprenol monophosphomannose synthase [Mobilicoccus massiliensis]